jgi:hypothetical protein
LIYDDKIKANLLNKYFCSISFVDDTNHVPPDIPSRTDALLSNIYITEHDVKDILQTLKIGKACGDGFCMLFVISVSVFFTSSLSLDFPTFHYERT